MPRAGITHDITIEDASAGTPIYGYPLNRVNGNRAFTVRDFRSIAPRILTESQITEAQFPPDVELLWTEQDWSKGIGGLTHRLHPNKLNSAYLTDSSIQGRITLARSLQSTTLDVAAAAHRPTGFAIVGTELWAFIGNEPYVWDDVNDQWDIKTAPIGAGNIMRNGVAYKGNTYAPGWVFSTNVATTYSYKADADAQWTASTLTDNKAKYMAVAGNLMYGGNWSDGVNYVRTSTDPTNSGTWSGATEVGGADSPITALVPDGDIMLICKTDGIYTIQADGEVKNLTPQFDDADQHPDNFKGSYNWNGHILLPLGLGGLMLLKDGQLHEVSLKLYAPRETQLQGRVVAITGNPEELYLMVLQSGQTRYHILKAVWREWTSGTDYSWHHVARQAYTTATDDDQNALFADGLTIGAEIHRRTWIGISSTGSTLGPFFLTSPGDTQDAYTATDGQAVTTTIDFGLPRVPKHLSSIDWEATGVGTGVNDGMIFVYYRLEQTSGNSADGGTTGWTFVGADQDASDIRTNQGTITFTKEVTGKIVQLLFVMRRSTTTTATPELIKYTLRAQLRPSSLKTLPLELVFGDDLLMPNGVRRSVMSAALTQLRTWNEGANEVVIRVPASIATRGADALRSFTMVLLPGYFEETEVMSLKGRRPTLLVRLLCAEVST